MADPRGNRFRRALKDNVFTNALGYTRDKRYLTSRTRFMEAKRSKLSMLSIGGHPGAAAEEEEEGQEGVDALETVLIRLGEMGRYQWIMFAMMMPFAVMSAYVHFGQMFLTPTPQTHWCRVPELADLAPALRRNLTAPLDPNTNAPHRCRMFKVDFKEVKESGKPPSANTPTQPCQHGWEFEYEDIPYATVTSEHIGVSGERDVLYTALCLLLQREWVCERASYVTLAVAAFFLGSFFGGFLFGYLADRFGRIKALVGANIVVFIGGIATVYSTQFWDFCLARAMVGMGFDNCFMLIYILVLEYVGPTHRTFVANMSLAVFGIGCVALPWVALWIGDWRTFTWVITAPMALVLLVPFIMPESARWLTSRGFLNHTIRVLDKVARVNKRSVPRRVMDKFIAEVAETHEQETIGTLLRSRLLRRMMLHLVACYMAMVLTFDCIVRLSENLGLNFFLMFSLSSISEIPSSLLVVYILDKVGRRILTCGTMFLTGLFTFIAIFVPKGVGQATLAIMARFTVCMSDSALLQWVTELLPTSVRGLGSAGVHVSGYLAMVVSPFIVYSEHLWLQLPFVFLTMLSLVSALVGLLLPETMGLPLPQTMADAEILVEEYSYYGKITQKIQESGEAIKKQLSTVPQKPVVIGDDDEPAGNADSDKKK